MHLINPKATSSIGNLVTALASNATIETTTAEQHMVDKEIIIVAMLIIVNITVTNNYSSVI